MVWKFCGKAQFGDCAFSQNVHNMKLSEITMNLGQITVFYAVFKIFFEEF